jgi:hypothetical protein
MSDPAPRLPTKGSLVTMFDLHPGITILFDGVTGQRERIKESANTENGQFLSSTTKVKSSAACAP